MGFSAQLAGLTSELSAGGLGAVGLSVPPSALAALSAAVLLLLLDHRRDLLGGRAAIFFLVASCGYGLLRSLSIRSLSEAHLGGAPYRLSTPLVTLWGVPLQELLGWTVAVGLAGYFADRLLRGLGQPTDPYRTSLVAALGMAAVCLAVETAAVSGGWWTWSLAHSPHGWLCFPGIALVDWGFVAFDFLLPFELWRRGASSTARWLSLAIFPIHLAGHALTAKLPGPLPISGFDFAHVGLIAAVFATATLTRAASPWPPLSEEGERFKPLLATLILLGTAATQLILVDAWQRLWTGLPLLAAAVVVASLRRDRNVAPKAVWTSRRAALLFGILLLVGLALRMPEAYDSREFEGLLRQAAQSLVANRPDPALEALQRALEIRPQHSEALWLLGWAELQKGQREEARRHLEASLAQKRSPEAERLLAVLDAASP